MTQRFNALRTAPHRYEFASLDNPMCPHCGYICDVSENDLWRLFEEGHHDVCCPACGDDFVVKAIANFSFSTDESDEDEE
jgi:hypothetical protein